MTELSHHDEFTLYKTDIHAWAKHVATRRAALLAAIPDPDERQRLWEQFGEPSRQALRDLAAARSTDQRAA